MERRIEQKKFNFREPKRVPNGLIIGIGAILMVFLILALSLVRREDSVEVLADNIENFNTQDNSFDIVNTPIPSSVLSSSSAVSITPSPSPTTTPVLSVLPSPTVSETPSPSVDVEEKFNTNNLGTIEPSFYTGPALVGPKKKSDLLIASFDSEIMGDWVIKSQEGTSIVDGKIGKGLSLGPGKMALVDGETFAASGTLSFWLKLDRLAGGESPILEWNFDGKNYSHSMFEISVVKDDVNRISFVPYGENGNDGGEINTGNYLTDSYSWNHLTVTWDLTKEPFKLVIYINGKKISEGKFPFAPVSQSNSVFLIGDNIEDRTRAQFTIDEIIMTNFAKSEEEVVKGE